MKQEWIDCKKVKPKKGEIVLIYFFGEELIESVEIAKFLGWQQFRTSNGTTFGGVSYWAPLPIMPI